MIAVKLICCESACIQSKYDAFEDEVGMFEHAHSVIVFEFPACCDQGPQF